MHVNENSACIYRTCAAARGLDELIERSIEELEPTPTSGIHPIQHLSTSQSSAS